MKNEYISFSAKLDGKEVRLTVAIKDLDIVSRDNEDSFDVEASVQDLKSIEFEDIY